MEAPQKFSSIDADKWARIKLAVKDKTGISIQTDHGANGAKGIQLSWIYSPDMQSLVVQLVKRSFFDPSEDVIDADIKALIEAA